MTAVSNAYKEIQKSSSIIPVRKIELYRRLPDGNGWEVSSIDITTEIVRLDRFSLKLDTDDLNVFKASNIQIEVDNSERQWDGGSSRFSGFLLNRSRIRISLGLKVNGVDEIFPVFNGVIDDFNGDSSTPTLQLAVRSLDVLLSTRDAELAGIVVTDELLGVGDGVTSEFFPSQFPLGVVKEIRVDGVPIRAGLRFSVSDTNNLTKKGKITFISAQPGPGQEVRADYIAWKTDQPIDQLVSDLLALVPQIPVSLIENIEFDPPVEREILHTLTGDFEKYEIRQALVDQEDPPPQDDGLITIDGFDTKAKWESGIRTDINLTRISDAISAQWTSNYEGDLLPEEEKLELDGDASFQWEEEFNAGAGVSRAVSGSVLSVNMPSAFYRIFNTKDEPATGRSFYARIKVNNLSGFIHIGGFDLGSSLGVQMSIISPTQVQIETGGNVFGPYSVNLSSFRNLRLTMRTFSPLTWEFYVDGSFVASGGVGSAPAGSFAGIFLDALATGQTNFELDFLRFNSRGTDFPKGEWVKEIDYGVHLAGLTSFSLITTLGPFFADLQGPPSIGNYYFSWKPNGGSYNPEVQVSNGSNLGSFSNVQFPRTIKFRIEVFGNEDSTLIGIKRLFLPAIAASNLIDGGSGLDEFTSWTGTFVNNDGSVQRFTAAPNNAGGFTFYQALGPNGEILTDDFAQGQGSSVQEIVLVALLSTSGVNTPILRESLINFTTRTVLISQAVLAGQKVLSVITELAKVADFEIGLDGNGNFFFRNKATASTPVITLDDSNVEKLNSYSPGWDRIFNVIRASFGNFVRVINSVTQGETPPTSNDIYNDRILSVGGGNLLFQPDADLANVMGVRYFNRYSQPKRRVTLTARFMPELELGERVSINLTQPRQIIPPFDARILGIAQDLMNFRTELDLQEL